LTQRIVIYYSLLHCYSPHPSLMHAFDHALVIIATTMSCFYLYKLLLFHFHSFFHSLTCHFRCHVRRISSRHKCILSLPLILFIPFVLYLWLCCYLLCFHILSLSLETQQQQNDAFGSRENFALLCVVLYSNTSLASIFVNFSLLSFLPHQLASSCRSHQHMYLYIAVPLPYSLTLSKNPIYMPNSL